MPGQKSNRSLNTLWLVLTTLVTTGCSDSQTPHPMNVTATPANTTTWPNYGGQDAQHYSDLSDITPENVDRLQKVWEYHTGDVADGKPPFNETSAFENTPLLLDGTLYLCSPFNRVIALDPASGIEKWTFDPEIDITGSFGNQLVCRGVSHWQDQDNQGESTCDKRILTATNDSRLIALDAITGKKCADFGKEGEVDLTRSVGDRKWYGEYHHTSPPLIMGDLAIVGSAISDNTRMGAPSGVLRAYDVRNGALRWAWDLAPPDYQPEADELTPDGYVLGTPNVWAPMIGDADRDLVFVPTGNPSPDYFRPGEVALDYYGSAIVALRASTGEVIWHFQMVHNDHWDFDTPAQPTLIDLERDGQIIPAVVQATKMGFLFVLNRETGEPIFPVEERPVPQVQLAGDNFSATQPFPVLPPPLVPTSMKPEDAWGLTPFDKGQCRKILDSLRFEGMYTVATEEPTLMYPGNAGGSNWGGVAADPERKIVIANVMDAPWVVQLIPRDNYEAGEWKGESGVAAQTGTPYAMSRQLLLSPFGLPCNPPPWGKLMAIDLNEGNILWEVPLGTVQDLAPVPIPWKLGVPNLGGPLVTKGGLIFIAATMDDYIRAFDITNGNELWKSRLPAGGQATPMTYAITDETGRDRQVVVIAAGGHGTAGTKLGDSLIAYALPN